MARVRTYLDHGSTSNPKPPAVWSAMQAYCDDQLGNPGRLDPHADVTRDVIEQTRASLAEEINAQRPSDVVFTSNATMALNIVLQGFLGEGDHVVVTSAEHNSVLRPLTLMAERYGISHDVVDADPQSGVDPADVEAALRPETSLVVVNHASNVTGSVHDIAAVGRVLRSSSAAFLVDASQSAGHVALDVQRDGIDFLALTGHKALLGPPGTGALYLRDPFAVRPLLAGGTGLASESTEQPEAMPFKFEAGTVNYAGIAGLGASLAFRRDCGRALHDEAIELRRLAWERLRELDEVVLYGSDRHSECVPIISFSVRDRPAAEIAHELWTRYGIMTRAGLHCAPLMHERLSTGSAGTVRVSFGFGNTEACVDRLGAAVREVVRACRD